MTTVAAALREAAAALGPGAATGRLDVELLMAHALGVSRSDLLLRHMREPVPPAFAALSARRLAGEPVAYITGRTEFWSLPIEVDPAVLIPRADSETLIEAARQLFANRVSPARILDCGTGSGALVLAALSLFDQAQGIGIDRSHAALAVATRNAAALGLTSRCSMICADWDVSGWSETAGGPYDLILANPPYVEDDAVLEPAVRDHEPAGALFAGPEGLDAYRVLLPQLPPLLARNGVALVEIGASQADSVGAIAEAAGFSTALHRDLAGRPRVQALTCLE